MFLNNKKWYVFDNTNTPKYPFSRTAHKGTLLILDLYYKYRPTVWRPKDYRLMVSDN